MRFAVYSAIVGNYDEVHQPAVLHNDFDFILFSNDIQMGEVGVWKIRAIPYSNDNPTKVARWVKTHPDFLLPDYDASIWIDSNVCILDSFLYDRVLHFIETGNVISSMWHRVRDCIYTEAAVVCFRGLDIEDRVLKWLSCLVKENYPLHQGLHETNVVFRRHCEPISKFDQMWWNCINENSIRDQLSFDYCLWKNSLSCAYFINSTENVRNSVHFRYLDHFSGFRKKYTTRRDIAYWFRGTPNPTAEKLKRTYMMLVHLPCYKLFKRFFVLYYHFLSFLAARRLFGYSISR